MSMKTKTISYLAITLIAVSSLFSVKAMALDKILAEAYEEVSEISQDSYDKKILIAKRIALQKMTNFMNNPVSGYSDESEIRNTLDKMFVGLKNAKIFKVKPEYISKTGCSKGADFYTLLRDGDSDIRICPVASGYSADAIAQKLDHEALHIGWKLMGIKVDSKDRGSVVESEGIALMYEFAITRNSNKAKCIYMDTGYTSDADIMAYLTKNDVGIPPLCKGSSSDATYGIASNQ